MPWIRESVVFDDQNTLRELSTQPGESERACRVQLHNSTEPQFTEPNHDGPQVLDHRGDVPPLE